MATHAPLPQSSEDEQSWSASQGEQAPPQSTSASSPLRTPSVQLPVTQRPLTHTPLSQSAPVAQCLPLGHGAHLVPPQSTSVSSPLSTPSSQVGVSHCPLLHTPLSQSLPS